MTIIENMIRVLTIELNKRIKRNHLKEYFNEY